MTDGTGPEKFLIVNADDFGLSDGVNRGIVEAHEGGIVTSASLMVRQPAAKAAADYARGCASLGVGLHLDLGEWAYVNGAWSTVYEVVDLQDAEQVSRESERQFAEFIRLIGRPPTHLDSHQHVHRAEPVRTIAATLAGRLHVPLRDVTPGVRYCGEFYGQDGRGTPAPQCIAVDALIRLLKTLPQGVTEMGCHPGLDSKLDSCYRAEREIEVRTLCSAAARETIENASLRLCNFAQISREKLL
jgi:predicted glycoside hydrolase/deacetylase ChbG (UPF0249 family)